MPKIYERRQGEPDIAFHDAANFFPLDEEHLDDLAADIQANGQHEDIELQDGKIIEGRRRYLACRRAGVEPRFRHVQVADPVGYVLSKNLHRRHLDASQRAMVAARAREWYDKQAKERMRAGGGDKKGAAARRSGVEKMPHPVPNTGKARDQAGAAVGVSGKSVAAATRVLREGIPELARAVDEGKLTVHYAAEVARLPADRQRHVLADRSPKKAAREAAEEWRERSGTGGEPEAAAGVGIALQVVEEALAVLDRIPWHDPQRKDALRKLEDWLRQARKREPARVRVLRALAENPGGLKRPDLARLVGLSESDTFSVTVYDEVRAGRVREERNGQPTDSRAWTYFLTAQGAKAIREGEVDSDAPSPAPARTAT